MRLAAARLRSSSSRKFGSSRRVCAVGVMSALFGQGESLASVFGGDASFHGEGAAKLHSVFGDGDISTLHCILDFDRTLTAHDCVQCHDSLASVDRAAFTAPVSRYLDFTDGGHPDVKGKPMRAWWDQVHSLLVEHRVTKAELDHARRASKIEFRQGAIEALCELRRLEIPTTVVSAGLEHVIVETLQEAGFGEVVCASECDGSSAPWSIRVLANKLEFSSSVVSGCWPEPPIDATSKPALTYTMLRAHFDAHPFAADRRLVVVGDSTGDAAVALNVPSKHCLAVGYFDPKNPWRKRPDFEAAFDVILPHTDDMLWLVNALKCASLKQQQQPGDVVNNKKKRPLVVD